jgi:hypothetical protein
MRRLNKRYWPHMVKTNYIDDKQNEIFFWCQKNFTGKDRWKFAGPNNWYFTKEKDVTMFLLAWST